ncbi:hypothetical protein D3C78_1328690 [compost metagenome]
MSLQKLDIQLSGLILLNNPITVAVNSMIQQCRLNTERLILQKNAAFMLNDFELVTDSGLANLKSCRNEFLYSWRSEQSKRCVATLISPAGYESRKSKQMISMQMRNKNILQLA